MFKTASGWSVHSVVATRRGVVPVEELTKKERQALADSITLAVARAMAPEGVRVCIARTTSN